VVAFPEQDSFRREARFAELLRDAGVCGEASDHRWMARTLTAVADALDASGEDLTTERLLAAAHLAGLNEPEAAEQICAAFDLPDSEMTAMRELLRSASLSPEGWRMIRLGVCRFDRDRGGKGLRWEIDGVKLLEVTRVWHELGERMMFRRLVRAFCRWVAFRNGNVEVVIRRAPQEAGPRWIEELRGALTLECGVDRLRVQPLITWDGPGVKAARSGSRRAA
jgi:hypothetical protein